MMTQYKITAPVRRLSASEPGQSAEAVPAVSEADARKDKAHREMLEAMDRFWSTQNPQYTHVLQELDAALERQKRRVEAAES
jgi:hypothetical protein